MIKSFKHKGLARFFETGSKAGIQPKHAIRLKLQLGALQAAKRTEDMNLPGWDWHELKGPLAGRWAVTVAKNWRVTYAFEGGEAILVDYEGYQ